MILNYPLFDGEKVIENASVLIENGKIAKVGTTHEVDEGFFLMPGLIDAHTHMETMEQVAAMLENGITTTCDVASSAALVEKSKTFTIIPSAGMTFGTLSGKSYVKNAIDAGARYIKVLLMEPNLMMKGVLRDICKEAHDNGRLVAVHAVSLKAVRMCIDCGVDVLIHVPMKEEFPEELAQTIADKQIAVVPTLVMMEAFSKSGWNGYQPEHYQNARNAVRLLHEKGVTILVGTDANPGTVAPKVTYGSSLHRELELLTEAGMSPTDVLAAATANVADVFGLADCGRVEEGKRAVLLLIEGRPDQNITDTTKIKQIWIDGVAIL